MRAFFEHHPNATQDVAIALGTSKRCNGVNRYLARSNTDTRATIKPMSARQAIPFTCGLACVASLSEDFGRPITQAELLSRYIALLLRTVPNSEVFEATGPEVLSEILQDLGYRVQYGSDHRRPSCVTCCSSRPTFCFLPITSCRHGIPGGLKRLSTPITSLP
jgi:hypothetical protein